MLTIFCFLFGLSFSSLRDAVVLTGVLRHSQMELKTQCPLYPLPLKEDFMLFWTGAWRASAAHKFQKVVLNLVLGSVSGVWDHCHCCRDEWEKIVLSVSSGLLFYKLPGLRAPNLPALGCILLPCSSSCQAVPVGSPALPLAPCPAPFCPPSPTAKSRWGHVRKRGVVSHLPSQALGKGTLSKQASGW